MRIHLVSHLFAPRPQGAFGAELAGHWARRGHEVVVFTADPAPPGGVGSGGDGGAYAVVGGLPLAYGRSSLAHRLASRAAFAASAAAASSRRPTPDVVLFAGALPLVGAAVTAPLARRQGPTPTRIVWLFDLWPDVLRAHRPDSAVMRALAVPLGASTTLALRRAHHLVAISPHMAHAIAARVGAGGEVPPVHTIPLWATRGPDRGQPPSDGPPAGAARPLRAMYHGNLGLSYDFEPILAAAARFAPGQVTFVLVGDGARHAELARRIERDKLANVELRPPLSDDAFAQSLATADVHLLPLRESWDGISFPSKLLPYLAVARPIVVVGPPGGESATLVREAGCGVSVPPRAEELEAALRALASDPARRSAMATAGRALYERRFSAARAFAAWDALLETARPAEGGGR